MFCGFDARIELGVNNNQRDGDTKNRSIGLPWKTRYKKRKAKQLKMDHCSCTCQAAFACNCDQWLDTMDAHEYNKDQETPFVVTMADNLLVAATLELLYHHPSSL